MILKKLRNHRSGEPAAARGAAENPRRVGA